ncbi:MAG: hypothetical protein WC026_06495 [Hyphomicrobium sp.]|uniref:hypothetical protein n=1 Tax=Hyphomicrobium sp. TaxID=82 RepID=UPI003567CAC2
MEGLFDMSDADDKSSPAETTETRLQSGTSGQVAVTEAENVEEPMKPIIVLPVAHQYSA